MKSISVQVLWTLVVVATFASLVSSELIVEKAALDSEIARSVSADFGKQVRTHWNHWHPVQSVSANSNGELAMGLLNGDIVVWNSATNGVKRTIKAHNALVSSIKYLPDGNLLSGGYDSQAQIWNVNDSYSLKCYANYGTGTEKFQKVLPILNSNYFAIARSTSVTVVNAVNCIGYRHLLNHTGEVLSLARLANDDLVSGSADKTIKIWNWRDGILKRTISGHSDSVTALVQLPTGELASGSADKTIKIWNPNDGTLIHTLSAHTGPITGLVVLQNGFLASSSSSDNTIRIWDTYRGVNLYQISGHTAGINDLALLPSGELASAGNDKYVRIWVAQ